MLDIPHAGQASVRRRGARVSPAFRDGAGWQGFVLVALGWSGVGVAFGFVGMSQDPGAGDALVFVSAVSVASIVAVAVGAVVVYEAARSATRRVFRSRVLFATAATLLAIAAVALVAFFARAPLDGIAAHGKPPAELMNELTFVAVSLTCVVGGVAAASEGWKARRNERSW